MSAALLVLLGVAACTAAASSAAELRHPKTGDDDAVECKTHLDCELGGADVFLRWPRMPTIVVRDRGGACGAAGWAQRGRVPTHDHGHERAERQSVHDALNDSVPSQRKVSLWWRKRGGCGLLFGVPPRPCVTGCSYGSHGGPRVRQTCFGRWIALARGHARAAPRAGHWRFPRSPVAKTWPRYLRDPALESRRAPPTGRRAVVARVGEAPSAAPCLLSLRRVCPSTRAVRKLRGNGYFTFT